MGILHIKPGRYFLKKKKKNSEGMPYTNEVTITYHSLSIIHVFLLVLKGNN